MHPTNTIFENQIAKKAPLKRDLLGAYRDSKAFTHSIVQNLLPQLPLCFRFEFSTTVLPFLAFLAHVTRVAQPMGHNLRDAVKQSAEEICEIEELHLAGHYSHMHSENNTYRQ